MLQKHYDGVFSMRLPPSATGLPYGVSATSPRFSAFWNRETEDRVAKRAQQSAEREGRPQERAQQRADRQAEANTPARKREIHGLKNRNQYGGWIGRTTTQVVPRNAHGARVYLEVPEGGYIHYDSNGAPIAIGPDHRRADNGDPIPHEDHIPKHKRPESKRPRPW
jgi:hypothetical protein